MKFSRFLPLLGGLVLAVALGVVLNYVTSDAGSGVAVIASVAALIASAVSAIVASRQVFLSKKALEEVRQLNETRFGVPTVTVEQPALDAHSIVSIGGVGKVQLGRWNRHSDNVSDEWKLLGSFADLEDEATRVLNRKLGERRRSIFDMRADLTRLGIWSEEDVRAFDRAVRMRNAIVHGDPVGVDESELLEAPRVVGGLITKIKNAS